MSSDDVEDEIVLPGLVGQGNGDVPSFGAPLSSMQIGFNLGGGTSQVEEIASDDEEVCSWM